MDFADFLWADFLWRDGCMPSWEETPALTKYHSMKG